MSALVGDFLDGGPGLWLAPGRGDAPAGCAVVATSGSTGEAKHVVLHRDALTAAARAAQERLGFSATWHLTLAPHYVAGLMVLVRGHLGDGVRTAEADLSDLAPSAGRNCLSIVGTQLHRALDNPAITETLAQFDAVLVGGAALRPELRARADEAGIRVIETYGMSETCGGVVWDGAPLPGVEIELGGNGRIVIGGPTLFAGYLTDPSPRDSFTTNDRGHWDGGKLIVDGRFDDVIITGGVNVDLSVVRGAASQQDSETAVLAVDDAEWGSRIVLFATSGTLESWRDTLRSSLPAAALPRQFVRVASIPRTDGGKPDRRILLGLAES